MALTTVSSDRLSTNVKTSNLGSELSKKVGQNKNLIINGAMQVAQRATSSTSAGYQTLDRFRTFVTNVGATVTQSQQDLSSSDTPYSLGFRKSFRTALSGAGTASADSEIIILQKIEAQDIATSGWNYTSTSSYVTLQFWFKCSTNQTFYCYLETKDGTSQSYPISFTASGNNTWTKITQTFPGNSNLQFDNNNGEGLLLVIVPFYGTDRTNNSKSLNQWSAFDTTARTPDYASTWLTAGASTFDITGVQLELGSVATDFEHRSFGQELALCERYFEFCRVGITTTALSSGFIGNSVQFRVSKRVAPTVTHVSNFNINNVNTPYGEHIDVSGFSSAAAYDGSGGGIKFNSLFKAECEL
jgi:hypothetical protein